MKKVSTIEIFKCETFKEVADACLDGHKVYYHDKERPTAYAYPKGYAPKTEDEAKKYLQICIPDKEMGEKYYLSPKDLNAVPSNFIVEKVVTKID